MECHGGHTLCTGGVNLEGGASVVVSCGVNGHFHSE